MHANMAMCWCCRCAYCTAASASEAVSSMAETKCKIAILAYIWHEGMLFGPSAGCVRQVGSQKSSMVASNHHMHTSLSYTMRLSIPVRTRVPCGRHLIRRFDGQNGPARTPCMSGRYPARLFHPPLHLRYSPPAWIKSMDK